jgi:hypothetical protein
MWLGSQRVSRLALSNGKLVSTRVPSPGADSIEQEPPISEARSAMYVSPPASARSGAFRSKPRPSSSTTPTILSRPVLIPTLSLLAPEWETVLRTASRNTKNSCSRTPSETAPSSPTR